MAPLGNTKEDDYYRNDSMKYCRHEEKKRKEEERVRSGEEYIGVWVGPCTSANLTVGHAIGGAAGRKSQKIFKVEQLSPRRHRA